MTGKMKVQSYFIAVFFLNMIYNLLPFFKLKQKFLNAIGMKIGSHTYIHVPVKFFSLKGICIGDNSTINPHCYLDGRSTIHIGNNVNVSHDTKIYTLGHDINLPDLPLIGAPVYIEDDVFIFSNVLIMPGVTIGKGAVVYAGSVVAKSVPPYTVVGGNPAKPIKERKRIQFEKINYDYWFAV